MDWRDIYDRFIWACFDGIEDFCESVTFIGGKRYKETLLVEVLFLILTIVAPKFKIWCFISWKEATAAIVLTAVCIIIQEVSRFGLRGIRSRITNLNKEDM